MAIDSRARRLTADGFSPGQQPGCFVSSGSFLIGQQVSAVLGGVVYEVAKSAAQVIEPGEVMRRDRRERRLVPGRGQQGGQVIEAEWDLEHGRRPGRIRAPLDQPGERDLHARRALAAGDARRPPAGLGEPLTTTSAAGAEGRSECGDATLDDRAEQDRRTETARRLAVRFEQLGRMAAAEPVFSFEALAKPDVEHTLRDDRVQRRALGSSPDGTNRAAAELDRGGQPDVDEVAGWEPVRCRGAGHAGPRPATIADGSTDRIAPAADTTR